MDIQKIICLFSVLALFYLSLLASFVQSDNSAAGVPVISIPQTNQIIPPAADAGQDIVTFVSTETMFNGHGSSVNDYITNYEWDFDGDGQYDWESAESGLTNHIYNAQGKYNAFFRVTDSQGNSSIDTIRVQVKRK